MDSLKRIYAGLIPQKLQKHPDALKFGILGAANIAPSALIRPALNHPEVVISAVAARDLNKAKAFAAKHSIPKYYGGKDAYQQALDNPDLDAIYISLPNSLHHEWTIKALLAGKHVLLEKPSSDTAADTRAMFSLAKERKLVLLEAFHYRFHPAIQRVKAILDSGEIGEIQAIEAALTVPSGIIPKNDIRFNYVLGGGALMDMGCYTLSVIRYLTSTISAPSAQNIVTASSESTADKVDRSTSATLSLPNSIMASLECDLGTPWKFKLLPSNPRTSVCVKTTGGSVSLNNFIMPNWFHSIVVQPEGKPKRVEKAFQPKNAKGEPGWTTYRYQLEAFVDRVRRREPQTWVTEEDSVANMEWIEAIYARVKAFCHF